MLTVTGSGFQQSTRATINGSDRKFTFVSETQGTVTPTDADVANAGRLTIVLINPNKDTFTGAVDVVDPGTSDTSANALGKTPVNPGRFPP